MSIHNMRSEVLTAVKMSMLGLLGCDALWIGRYFRFGGTYCLHLQGIFGPEDGGSIFLRNAGTYLQAHTALQPRRPTWTVSMTSDFVYDMVNIQ
jgi:hypothetical protein